MFSLGGPSCSHTASQTRPIRRPGEEDADLRKREGTTRASAVATTTSGKERTQPAPVRWRRRPQEKRGHNPRQCGGDDDLRKREDTTCASAVATLKKGDDGDDDRTDARETKTGSSHASRRRMPQHSGTYGTRGVAWRGVRL